MPTDVKALLGANTLRDTMMSNFPDGKVHGANMGLIWGQQDPDGPHVGPMNFALWVGSPQGYENSTLKPEQHDQHFTENILKIIF